MSNIETMSHMIMNLYDEVKSKDVEPMADLYAFKLKESEKALDFNKLTKVLEKIDSYGKLNTINTDLLILATLVDYKYGDFYEILEYYFIPEVFYNENKIKYYLIKFNIVKFFTDFESVHIQDLFYEFRGIKKYLLEDTKAFKYQQNFERYLPIDMRAKYSIEVDNMINILIVIYSVIWGTDYSKLDSILLQFMDDYQEEMKLHGVDSWYQHWGFEQRKINNRFKYVLFLEHYLIDRLNEKKEIK